LAGAWLLREAEQDENLRSRMKAGLDKFLEQDRDRELFGLTVHDRDPAPSGNPSAVIA
jgi:hypothetical protein